jgi:hypothetical protein
MLRYLGRWTLLFFTIGIGALGGCLSRIDSRMKPHMPETQAEAGMTTVAVIGVEHWADVASVLLPKFALATGDEARTRVLATTSAVQDKILDAFGAGLSVGLPTSTNTIAATLSQATGQPDRATREETRSQGPGTAPNVQAGDPVAGRSASSLPGIDFANNLLKVDPQIEYQLAQALLQEVQLLNREVISPALRHGYEPYIVRLQVNVTPFARQQPFDVYTQIAFFTHQPQACEKDSQKMTPEWCKKARELPYVVPLLVTDNIETTRMSVARDAVRQLGAQLAGTVSNVGIQAQLQRLVEDLETVAGTSSNSLQSVNRLTDNAVQVRFGAVSDPSVDRQYGRSMVVRNYRLALLLLVPRAADTEDSAVETVSLSTKTELRNSRTGELLPLRHESELGERFSRLEKRFDLTPKDPATRLRTYGDLTVAVVQRDQKKFCSILARDFEQKNSDGQVVSGESLSKGPTQCVTSQVSEYTPLGYAQNLWVAFTGLISAFDFQTTSFHLPRTLPLQLPEAQTAALLDDRKAAATARLLGGHGLTPERIAATLSVDSTSTDGRKRTFTFVPDSVSTGQSGRDLILRFPSPAATGLRSAPGETMVLQVRVVDDPRWHVLNPTDHNRSALAAMPQRYTLVYRPAPSTEEKGVQMALPVEHLLTDASGKGSLVLTLSFPKIAAANTAVLGVANAEVVNLVTNPGAALQKRALNTTTINGSPGATVTVTLDLAKLTPQQAVVLNVIGVRDGEQSAPQSKDVKVYINQASVTQQPAK